MNIDLGLKRTNTIGTGHNVQKNNIIQKEIPLQVIEKKLKEFDQFEQQHKTTMPSWYKNYMLARADLKSVEERPFEYVYNAIKLRPQLLNVINNNYIYCLNDPEFSIR